MIKGALIFATGTLFGTIIGAVFMHALHDDWAPVQVDAEGKPV